MRYSLNRALQLTAPLNVNHETEPQLIISAVITNCFILHFGYNINAPSAKMEPEGGFTETLFITFGLYLFAVGGPSYVVPNVAVFARDPPRMSYVVACVFAGIGVLYTVSGNRLFI